MMKILGLVGGTGWISTVEYYRIINEETNRRCSGLTFSNCILYSINYGEIDSFNRNNKIEEVYQLILNSADKLVKAGVQGIVLCANTTHRFVDQLSKEIQVPIIHIAEATANEINKLNLKKIGLLGTKQTMELDFYKKKLADRQIETLIPNEEDRNFIQATINQELLKGNINEKSREHFLQIINHLRQEGAEGIVLGCTEIPLLVKQEHIDLPLFDTLRIHANAAVDFALND
jgi:aspartate racemase